jgi:hypothetical protein
MLPGSHSTALRYLRIIPADMSIPSPAVLALSDWPDADFHGAVNFV